MVLYTNILLDYEDSIEILFTLPPGTALSYPNEVIEYVRASDVKTVPHISSAGMREINFQMQTNVSRTLERQLDYFRRSGKSLLLFIPTEKFASEIVITDVSLPEIVSTYQTFTISAYCYGVEGRAMLADDPSGFWVTATTPDADSICGDVITLDTQTQYISIPNVPADNVFCIPADYTVWVRAKSSAGTADDLRIGINDTTLGDLDIDYYTVTTSAYAWYVLEGTIETTSEGNDITFYSWKETTETNDLYIDVIAFVHSSGLITV